MSTTSVVVKILEEIKRKASLHSQKHKNIKLKDQLRLKSQSNIEKTNNLIIRRRFTIKSNKTSSSDTDFFTRLVNSSSKPPVLRSLHHPVATHLLKLSHSSNYRSYRGLVLLSSLKLIKEYCERNGPCNRIYTTSHSNKLLSDPDVKFNKVLIVSKKLLQRVSDIHSYDKGLLAEVPYPEPSVTLGIPRLVLCVCPSGKTNTRTSNKDLGSVIRSAQALEWQAVWILHNGDIDLLDPVSIRSSQYTLSTIPYSRGKVNETLEFIKKNNLMLCHCTKNGLNVDSNEFEDKLKTHQGIMLMIGNLPYDLYSQSTPISVNPTNNNLNKNSDTTQSTTIKSHTYFLDDLIQTSVAMYLIKKNFFPNLPRSPFISHNHNMDTPGSKHTTPYSQPTSIQTRSN